MTKRLKIGLVAACPFPLPRGTPIRILRMAEALAGLGHEVHIITYHLGNPSENNRFKIHRIAPIRFYTKTDPGPTFAKLAVVDTALALKVLAVHRKLKFDIIHAHHYEGLLAALPIRLFGHTPVIFDAHTLLAGELHHYDLAMPKRITRFISRKLDRILPRWADHIVSVSTAIRESLVAMDSRNHSRVTVLPNGVELDKFLAQPFVDPIPINGAITLAYAGNFSPYQRVDVLLAAYKLVRQGSPNAVLEIYTEDAIERVLPLIESAGLLNSVRLYQTPFNELPPRLANADILLNPRMDGAGHPLKLLNYMAAGRAIVSFQGSAHGLAQLETGMIVEDESAEAFAGAVLKLIADPDLRQTLGVNARAFVAKHHVWETNAHILTRIYEELLAR